MHLLDCYNLCYLLPNMTAYHSDYIMILCCSLNGLFFKCQTSPASNMMWFNNKYTTTTCELADHAWSSGHKMVGNSVTLSATSWACLLAQRLMLQPLSMPSIAILHHLRWDYETASGSLSSTHQNTNIYWHPKRIDWQQSHHFQRNQTQAYFPASTIGVFQIIGRWTFFAKRHLMVS